MVFPHLFQDKARHPQKTRGHPSAGSSYCCNMLEKPYEIHILDVSILKISEFYSAPVIHGIGRTGVFLL